MPSTVSIEDDSSVVGNKSRDKSIPHKSIILLSFSGDIIEQIQQLPISLLINFFVLLFLIVSILISIHINQQFIIVEILIITLHNLDRVGLLHPDSTDHSAPHIVVHLG